MILTKCLKQSISEMPTWILQNHLATPYDPFSFHFFFFFNISTSNTYVVSDKIILFFILPFYNLVFMKVHNMASADVDQVNMEGKMASTEHRKVRIRKKFQLYVCMHP